MKLIRATALVLLTMAYTTSPHAEESVDTLTAEGSQLIKEFAGALQAELRAAIQSDGPAHAVDVCQVQAQVITQSISDSAVGWTISRSSHRLRNPANAPDAYTATIMSEFLERADGGEPVTSLSKAQIIENNDRRMFRMVKAIPTGAVCLTCHGGTEVSSDVEDVIKKHYPDDAARNFEIGDMRGVFSLTKRLDQ